MFGTLLKVVNRNRAFVYTNVAVAVAVTVFISFILPYSYTSTAKLLPSLDSTPGLSTEQMGAQLFSLGAALTNPGDIYALLLETRSVREEVINRLDLQKRYRQKTMDGTIKELGKHISVDVDLTGLITITVSDKDPQFARKLVMTLTEVLDETNKRISMTKGKKSRIFLEGRLAEVDSTLRSYSDSLKALQEQYKTFDLTAEMVVAVQSYAAVKAQLMVKEYLLQSLLSYSSRNHPDAKQLANEISILKAKLARFEKSGDGGYGAGFGIPFSELPEVAAQLVFLKRDIEVYNEVFLLLTEEYEKAKLMEHRDTPTFSVVDEGEVPQERAWPKRTFLLMVFLVLSLLFGVYALLFEDMVGRLHRGDNEGGALLKGLRQDVLKLKPGRRKG